MYTKVQCGISLHVGIPYTLISRYSVKSYENGVDYSYTPPIVQCSVHKVYILVSRYTVMSYKIIIFIS